MGAHKTVVYAGPTISPPEIYDLLPAAQVRQPVARGDLLKEEWTRGDTAIIIDGYFRQQLSVGHKEILWLVREGVHVIGGASMGALRAAELSLYGMIGVGSVFNMYATGDINGDDEVAVLHGPGELGYPVTTIAMVNIRYGCHEGAKSGLVPEAIGKRIIEVLKSQAFPHRTWAGLAEALGPDAGSSLEALRLKIGAGEWDVKRLDAKLALRDIEHRRIKDSESWEADTAFNEIPNYTELRWKWVREYSPGRWMSDLDVLNAARLFDQGYPKLHELVLTEMLEDFAKTQRLQLASYTRAKLGVDDRSDLPRTLTSWLTEPELSTLSRDAQLALVMVRVWPVWQSTDWRPNVLWRMRASTEWPEWSKIVFRADEAADRNGSRRAFPPSETCGKLYLRHWNAHGTSTEVEMARRGFYSIEELGRAVRRFFALDVQNTLNFKED